MSAIWFLLVGWWLGISLWCLGILFRMTLVLWPVGEMCDDLAHQAWRV